MGYGVVEQGDDRLSPTVTLGVTASEIALSYYFYGMSFGPVFQKTHGLSLAKTYTTKFLFIEELQLKAGASYILEITEVSYTDEADKQFNGSESQSNVGFFLGISPMLFRYGTYEITMNWESLIFPAGLGGILLSTARKEFLYLGFSKDF